MSPRWLAAGGAVVLSAVIGLALMLQNGGSACAAPPSTSAKSGKATFYDLGSGTGNCSFPAAPSDDLFVALGPDQYSNGAACGTYLDVTGPKGKVRVKVLDSCPECAAGHLDLSRTAFKKIADEVQGIVPITYKTVKNPTVPGPLSVRIQEGASQYWFSALIDNHGNRLTSVKVVGRGGATHTAKPTDYGYWIIDSGAGTGPYKLRITDVYGLTATISGITMSPGRTQKTSVRLSSAGSSSSPSSSSPAAGSTAATPGSSGGSVKASPHHSSAAAVTSRSASGASTGKNASAPSASSASSVSSGSGALLESSTVGAVAPPADTALNLAAGTPASCG